MDLSKLCVHTITTKPWPLEKALEEYSKKGIGGISIWENAIEELGAVQSGELIHSYPIDVVSYVRGGFFAHASKSKRDHAINHNKKLIEEAAAIGAPLLVLVCGADPEQSLEVSRMQIQEGIEQILFFAQQHNVQLGIEPLHPMYAASRSAINTVKQANAMAEEFDDNYLGVVVDVYHIWWEPELEKQIARCGANNNLLAYHICDWKMPMTDILNDRGLMGEGSINLQEIRAYISDAGFDGFHEVEIFSNKYWAMDQHIFLDNIIKAYQKHS